MTFTQELHYMNLTVEKTDMFYIVCQEDQPSRHGGYITEIKFISLKNGQEYHTYVDENNRNYKNWYEIVQHPQSGYVVNNLKLKKDNLISADSRPRIQKVTVNQQDLETVIVEYLDNYVYGTTNRLFKF